MPADRLPRRQFLVGASVAALTIPAAGSLVSAGTARAEGAAARMGAGRIEVSFDEGWLFSRGDASEADQAAFDDSGWQVLDLPHDWSIEDLPYATSAEGGVTADPSLLVPRCLPRSRFHRQ